MADFQLALMLVYIIVFNNPLLIFTTQQEDIIKQYLYFRCVATLENILNVMILVML